MQKEMNIFLFAYHPDMGLIISYKYGLWDWIAYASNICYIIIFASLR